MNSLTNEQDDEIRGLRYDGERFDLNERFSVVLRIEQDEDASLNDYDCYGRTEKYSHRYTDGGGRVDRPADFTGAARKIQTDRGSWIWWEPAADFRSAKAWGGPPDEYADAFRRHVECAKRLLSEGFASVGLELHELVTDSLGNEHDEVIDQQWVGGVDTVDSNYLPELINELLYELADVPLAEGNEP